MTADTHSATALAMPMIYRPCISLAQLSRFQTCPRAFAFEDIDSVEPEFTLSSVVFEEGIRQAISLVHESQLEGLAVPRVEVLMQFFRESMDMPVVPIRFDASQNLDTLMSVAEGMLKAFLASEIGHPKGEIICIEEAVRGSIDPDLPDIEGKVNLATLTHDGAMITDYRIAPSGSSVSDFQQNPGRLPLLVQLVGDRIFGDSSPAVSTQIVTITADEAPKIGVAPVSIDAAMLEAARQQLRELWIAISSGVFPARPGRPCKSCPFQSRCDSAVI